MLPMIVVIVYLAGGGGTRASVDAAPAARLRDGMGTWAAPGQGDETQESQAQRDGCGV